MMMGKTENEKNSYLTAKLQILPDAKAQKALLKTMRAYRSACQNVSKYARVHKTKSVKILNKMFYTFICRKYLLPAQMAQSVSRTVAAAYKAMDTQEIWTHAKF